MFSFPTLSAQGREEFAGQTHASVTYICKLASMFIHWSYKPGFYVHPERWMCSPFAFEISFQACSDASQTLDYTFTQVIQPPEASWEVAN